MPKDRIVKSTQSQKILRPNFIYTKDDSCVIYTKDVYWNKNLVTDKMGLSLFLSFSQISKF